VTFYTDKTNVWLPATFSAHFLFGIESILSDDHHAIEYQRALGPRQPRYKTDFDAFDYFKPEY